MSASLPSGLRRPGFRREAHSLAILFSPAVGDGSVLCVIPAHTLPFRSGERYRPAEHEENQRCASLVAWGDHRSFRSSEQVWITRAGHTREGFPGHSGLGLAHRGIL